MWCAPALIVVLLTNAASLKLRCVVNYLDDEKEEVGALVYIGRGGSRVNALAALVEDGRKISWSVINGKSNRKSVLGYAGNYVILGSGDPLTIVKDGLEDLSSYQQAWEPASRVIVILAVHRNLSEQPALAARLISLLWENSVFDTVIMFENLDSDEDVQVYSADPFAVGNRCGTRARKLLNFSTCGHDLIYKEGDKRLWLYPEQYTDCSMRVSRRDSPPFSFPTHNGWDGIDIRFIEVLRSTFNLSIKWSERPSPESGAPREVVHMYYKNLSRHNLDLAIGGNVMLSNFTFEVEYLRSHSQHILKFYVADAPSLKGVQLGYTMFSTPVWCVLGLSLLTGGLSFGWLVERKVDIERTMILIMVAILLGQSLKMSRRWELRIVLAMFLLPLYHISSLHLTFLQTFMVHPPTGHNILTEEELREANWTVLVTDTNYHLISDVNKYKNLKPVMIPNGDLLDSLEAKRDFALLARSLDVDFRRPLYHYRIHPLRGSAGVLSVSMAMSKGDLYLDIVEKLTLQCMEAGFFRKWTKDLTLLRKNSTRASVIDNALQPLDLEDLGWAFVFLLFGCTLASIAFLCELAWHRRQTEKRKLKNLIASRQKQLETHFQNYVFQRKGLF